MDSGDEYEVETITHEIGGYQEDRENDSHSPFSSHSEQESDNEEPPILSPPHHTMDIPSVRRPPVPVMVPADRVLTHDLPLAETLSAAEGELFPRSTISQPRGQSIKKMSARCSNER